MSLISAFLQHLVHSELKILVRNVLDLIFDAAIILRFQGLKFLKAQ